MNDDHEKRHNGYFNSKRVSTRIVDELIGLTRGIIADKEINFKEAKFLQNWIKKNITYCNDPIVNRLYNKINDMLDGRALDKNDQVELIKILADFSGESLVDHCEQISTTLPFCSPPPIVEFPGSVFCLTGKFAYGPRKICQEVIVERGGYADNNVTQNLDYLVIGTFCSSAWLHAPYGRKIMDSVDLIKRGFKTRIISEDHWAHCAFRS